MLLSKRFFARSRALASRAGPPPGHAAIRQFSLSTMMPSKVSTKAAISKHKQALMNVGFSFFTCILGAQVLRLRYDVDNEEEERNELRKSAQDIYRSIHASRLEELCKDMEASPAQCKAIENYFGSMRSLIPGDFDALENTIQKEIIQEKAAAEAEKQRKPKVKKFVV
jgi:hypothetical protein